MTGPEQVARRLRAAADANEGDPYALWYAATFIEQELYGDNVAANVGVRDGGTPREPLKRGLLRTLAQKVQRGIEAFGGLGFARRTDLNDEAEVGDETVLRCPGHGPYDTTYCTERQGQGGWRHERM